MSRPELFPQVAAFVEVVRRGSFTRAADALGISRGTMSRHINQLEEALAIRLLHRTTRSVRPTDEGKALYARFARALDEWDAALHWMTAQQSEPRGSLRVTAPAVLGSRFIAPIAARFLDAFPQVDLDLILDDGVRDLVSDGFDVAIRAGILSDSSYRAIKLIDDEEIIVGAPALCGKYPVITRDILGKMPWIRHAQNQDMDEFVLRSGDGDETTVAIQSRARTSSVEGHIALAVAGVGLARIPYLFVKRELTTGELVVTEPRWYGRRLGIHAVFPSRDHISTRLRAFLDALHAGFHEA